MLTLHNAREVTCSPYASISKIKSALLMSATAVLQVTLRLAILPMPFRTCVTGVESNSSAHHLLDKMLTILWA